MSGQPLFPDLCYCTRCCMPESNEGIKFDDMGICQACQSAEQKIHIDWTARERKLRDLLQHYANLGNDYDCIVPISGGKDSTFAMHIMEKQNYEISCLISLRSANPDSYMFHTPNIDMTRMQAEAIGLPLIEQETKGEKENELADLKAALILAKKEHRIDGVVTGALYSNYQRERIESIADSLGLKIFSPLWHMDQEMEMRNIIDAGFKIILSSVAAEGLNKTWLGRELGHKDVDKLVALNKKIGLNIAGEGGEFESLVVDGPMFKKKIQIVDAKIISDSQINAKYNIKKAKMMDKN